MSKSQSLSSIVPNIFVRLPLGFLVPFIGLLAAWTLLLKPIIELLRLPWPKPDPIPSLWEGIWSVWNLYHIVFAFLTVVVYATGIIAIYNLSVGVNWLAVRWKLKPVSHAVARPYRPPSPNANNPFKDKRIGIVLAGGGAKGAFQAGAMKAIYRYLAERNALDNVKAIAGTSIGAWNALFWLADLIEAETGGEPGILKTWWKSIRLRALVAPSWYVPGLRNAFFKTAPWEQNFDALFGQAGVAEHLHQSRIHFYLVRHRVDTGTLACTTNNQNALECFDRTARVSVTVLPRPDELKKAAFLEGVKTGVFASMDLPPLFPYIRIGKNFYEDGGVIDNLPIMFPAMEGCEIIFVLPLNADFNAAPDHRSVTRRFLRILDVRQGALEQNSLKGVYLFNELAALRDYIQDLQGEVTSGSAASSKTLDRALKRTHKEARIFGVCPQRSFVEATIDTQEMWKGEQAADALEVMENATAEILQSVFDLKKEEIEIAVVDEFGGWHLNNNF